MITFFPASTAMQISTTIEECWNKFRRNGEMTLSLVISHWTISFLRLDGQEIDGSLPSIRRQSLLLPPPLLYLIISLYLMLYVVYIYLYLPPPPTALSCIHLYVPTSSSSLSKYLSIYCSMLYTSICSYILILSISVSLYLSFVLWYIHLSVPPPPPLYLTIFLFIYSSMLYTSICTYLLLLSI